MFSKPHNENLLNDVMKILSGGQKAENDVRPAPQWVVDASHDAAQTLLEAYASGEVVTSETKRDILRKHFAEAVGNCGCNAGKDDPIHFEKEVQKRMNEGIVSTKKLATPKTVAQKTAKPPTKSMPVNKGLASQKESIAADMRHFLAQLTQEEIEVLTDVISEGSYGYYNSVKQLNQHVRRHFDKYFGKGKKIPVELHNEIYYALSYGGDPENFMPALVKKYANKIK